MNIEDVQDLRADLDVGPERATFFAARGEVVIVPGSNGQARECKVAIRASVQRAIRAEARLIAGQCAFDFARLIVQMRAGSVDDLLQAEDVGVKLFEDGDDASG